MSAGGRTGQKTENKRKKEGETEEKTRRKKGRNKDQKTGCDAPVKQSGDGAKETATKETAARTPLKHEELWKKFSVLSLIFFTVSFLGWCLEVVFCSSGLTNFCDRGFLTLPFCVIYGAPLCLIYLILGTPNCGLLSSLCKKIKNPILTKIAVYGLYFILSAAIATLFELVFGYLFHLLGVRLWDYSYKRVHFRGYICPTYSLIWGVLITLAMRLVFPFLYRLFSRIPVRISAFVSLVLWVAVGMDFFINFSLLITSYARPW